ncbi:MAG: glycerophosphodiester phosphodiesterase family protein [Woeseiaceae bacterium]|nr:glycerophosphodiester phosphodiesterase family protein [Woeseiaceae bacterium]
MRHRLCCPADPEGLAATAEYADGIGPWLRQLYAPAEIDGHPVSTGVVSAAHAAGLVVHPYTFRADAPEPAFGDFATLVQWFVEELAIDGLFTDFPDRARRALAGT